MDREFCDYVGKIANRVAELLIENSASKGVRLTVTLDAGNNYATIVTSSEKMDIVTRHGKVDDTLKKVEEVFGND